MELIAKKYRVLENLGQGAMGEVFLVLPPRGEPVALKLLKTAVTKESKSAIEQFENEFKVLKKLSHPNIGKIFDYGYEPELNKVFFTSPWLKGKDLFKVTEGVSVSKCEDYLVQVLRAINYLHQKGIIHCDLKPGNVFVEDDTILLIDFGLAGYWGESIVGTPTYLAPEIFRGERHSIASDLYAVGITFYNCLTRAQPFSGSDLQEVYDRHRTHTPPPVDQLNPKIPKYLSDVIATLLSKKAAERYESAAAVIEEVAAYSETKYSVETPETLLSYLPTSSELIGRKDIQWRIDKQLKAFLAEPREVPYFGTFIYGGRGLGKSKFVSQMKSELQINKVVVEEAVLPLTDSDRSVLEGAEAIVLEDMENYLTDAQGKENLDTFLSFLETKILSPNTKRFMFLVSGSNPDHWKPFESLFPKEDFVFDSLMITAFTEEETRVFLEKIIGQQEIPGKFVSELYRNTEGNPGILTQIVQNLIQQGLLFDESGRWSTDLLSNLENVLKKVEFPRSLEEQIRIEYDSFSLAQKEIVHWLSLSPHGLNRKMIEKLTSLKVKHILKEMTKNRIVRTEGGKTYFLYRSSVGTFIQKFLPSDDQKWRHARLSQKDIGLDLESVLFHQSRGDDFILAQNALESLAELLSQEGKKEEALECFQSLISVEVDVPLIKRLQWAVQMSEIFIWLNRFSEAEKLLTKIEGQMPASDGPIPLKNKLVLWEKKGLSLLHQEKIEEAKKYFIKGLELAKNRTDTMAEEIRFLNDLAEIEIVKGQFEKSISIFRESRVKARQLSKSDLRKITNNDLGHVHHQLKNHDQAISLLKEDIKIFSKMKAHEPYARALYSLAESYRALKKFKKAIKGYKRCIEMCQKENIFTILLRAYNGLGNIYLADKKYQEALHSYQRAIDISVHLKDPTTKAALLANQGLIYRNEKNWTQASRRFLLAKQILESKEKKLPYEEQLLAKCYNELTFIAREEKDKLKALSYQLEQVQMVEGSEVLKGEEFGSKLDLAELYLENRLNEPFVKEIKQLEKMAKGDEEKEKVKSLHQKWEKIQRFDQESTVKID